MCNTKEKKELKVLIIEDSLIINHIHKTQLQLKGYSPDCVMNGKDAIQMVEKNHYDLILTDIDLPDMDGVILTERLRMIEGMHNQKPSYIVGITAYSPEEIKSKCNISMNDLIQKPLKEHKLNDILSSTLKVIAN